MSGAQHQQRPQRRFGPPLHRLQDAASAVPTTRKKPPPPMHRTPVIAVPEGERPILGKRRLSYGEPAITGELSEERWRWSMVEAARVTGDLNVGEDRGSGPVRDVSSPEPTAPEEPPPTATERGGRMSVSEGGRGLGGLNTTALAVVGAMLLALVTLVVVIPASGTSAGVGRFGVETAVDNASPLTDAELSSISDVVDSSVVRIAGIGCDGPAIGTGFVIDGELLTSAHLVSASDSVTVSRPGLVTASDVRTATVDQRLSLLDLAIIDQRAVAGPSLRPAAAAPAVGAPVVIAGMAGGNSLVKVSATVHLVVPGGSYGLAGTVLLLDEPITPGFSGGPVLDRAGRVVAVVKGVDEATGLTVATGVGSLLDIRGQAPTFSNNEAVGFGCE